MNLLKNPQKQLTALQWQALQSFFKSPVSAPFFLTGGTALAGFYFAHRTSVDLDLFTLTSLDHQALKKHLEEIASDLGGEYQIKTSGNTILTGNIVTPAESLKVDLVHDIPIHHGELQVFDLIRIDSLENIGSNKITAIYGRLEPKDYVDLYWTLKVHGRLNFEDLLGVAKRKDLGLVDFHLGHIFAAIPENFSFPPTTPPLDPTDVRKFYVALGNTLIARSPKPQYG